MDKQQLQTEEQQTLVDLLKSIDASENKLSRISTITSIVILAMQLYRKYPNLSKSDSLFIAAQIVPGAENPEYDSKAETKMIEHFFGKQTTT